MIATHYRRATRGELDVAVEWAAQERWNPGRADADAFWAADPDGFVCAERAGEVIATGSVVSYGGRFGFMGFFIVRPDLRGRGIGREFWYWRRDRLLERLDDGASIGMDGVFAMQPFYRSGGFEFAHRNLRMSGVVRAVDGATPVVDGHIVDLATLSFDDIVEFDRSFFRFARPHFLEPWIDPVGGRGLGALDGDEIVGVGVIRPCRSGFKVGPLFARHPRVASSLFDALVIVAHGHEVSIDVPEINPDALALAERHRLTERFGCARMYHGEAPPIPWEGVYGVTTFELG
jgi:GNAT superfamily N-acetyltransferase